MNLSGDASPKVTVILQIPEKEVAIGTAVIVGTALMLAKKDVGLAIILDVL